MSNSKEDFIIGDNWVYFKLYTGFKTSEKILIELIKPFTQKLLLSGVITKWFYVRYADPEHHLRVRFFVKKKKNVGSVISEFYPFLIKFYNQKLIWKVQLDTYTREIERYGNKTIDITETLFFYDSIMIIDVIVLVQNRFGEDLRWLFALKIIDSFLNNFNFEDSQKELLLSELNLSFLNEFGNSKYLRQQLGNKFREKRKLLENFMTCNGGNNEKFNLIDDALDKKSKNIKPLIPIFSKFFSLETNSKLDLNSFLKSHIHMTMNRLFKSKNRLNELACYDLLYRYYKSKNARTLKKNENIRN